MTINFHTDRKTLIEIGKRDHATYASGTPFPHVVIDDFFDPTVMNDVLAEVRSLDRSKHYTKYVGLKTDHNKFTFYPDVVGPNTSRLADFLNSSLFLTYLEQLTGIQNLLPDPSYFGGGVHWIENGGYLEVHADFNHLKKYNLERRINLLLYLNQDWKDEYNGQLELWDRPTMTKQKEVAPLFNRTVIFSTTKEALHGHPLPLNAPPGIGRRSLALYYYTNTWEPSVQAHNTIYYASQNHKTTPWMRFRGVVADLTPPILYNALRALKRTVRGQR